MRGKTHEPDAPEQSGAIETKPLVPVTTMTDRRPHPRTGSGTKDAHASVERDQIAFEATLHGVPDRADKSEPNGATSLHHSPLIGAILGDFEILDRIGAGAFGDVYRAWQRTLDREAVVKVARGAGHLAGVAEQFLLEAKLASQLDHPYAAHIYAFGHDHEREVLWIAMEFIRGIELRTYLKQRQQLPLDELVDIFERICEVVHTAHEIGIIHRDLKPANIMLVDRAGRRLPKLLDFGVAKLSASLHDARSRNDAHVALASMAEELDSELSATLAGTPAYMSPEQWHNSNAVDARSDIYALGIILYESITGRRPFRGKELDVIKEAHCHLPVPPMDADVPPAVFDVVVQALAKQPEQRFADTLKLAEALTQASGLSARRAFRLPQQAEGLRLRWTERAPQPIAESLSLLRAARSSGEAHECIAATAHTVAQYLGVLALSSASRVGWAQVRENSRFADAVVALDRGGFSAFSWLSLAREISRPFIDRRQAFPLPSLVDVLFLASGAEAPMPEGAQRLLERSAAPRSRRDISLTSALSDLAEFLLAVNLVLDYPLIAVTDGVPQSWVSTRKPARQIAYVRQIPAQGRATLVDLTGDPVLDLHPFVQLAAPSAGEPDEMFFFDGIDRERLRMVALPTGYERFDEDSWSDLRGQWLLDSPERPDVAEPQSPFRGLAAFRPQDSEFYFGREHEANDVRNLLLRLTFIAVVGPSGSGKSSFVQAGVIAPLPADWQSAHVRPGTEPLTALASLLAGLRVGRVRVGRAITAEPDAPDSRVSGRAMEAIHSLLRDRPEHFGEAVREYARRHAAQVIVFADQLEELFTLGADPDEQRAFSCALMSAARAPSDPVRVIVAVRDDFLARAGQVSGFRGRLGRAVTLLGTPDVDQLRRIITEPVRRSGYKFDEPAVIDDILAEVAGHSGSLPLLSFAAAELWSLRDRHFKKLTRGAYESIGGVVGALARYAERELESMSAGEQRLVREVFRQLVTGEGTRAVVSRTELLSALDDETAGAQVIERLLAARLLVSGDQEHGDHIEIVHEALLAEWPRLVEWQREDSQSARMRDQIRAAAKQWADRGRPSGLLWRGDVLAEYRVWRQRFTGNQTALERQFARASIAEESRGRRVRNGLIAAVIVTLIAALAAVLWMYRATQERLYQSFEDRGRRELISGQPVQALRVLNQAYENGRRGIPLRFALARASNVLDRIDMNLTGHEDAVLFGEVSPDGRQLITSDAKGFIHIWNPQSGALLRRFRAHETGITHLVIGVSWSDVLTVDHDGLVRLWDLASATMRGEYAHAEPVIAIQFSGNRRYVATKTLTGVARVWDVNRDEAVTVRDSDRLFPSEAEMQETAFCRGDTQVLIGAHDGQLHSYTPTGDHLWSIPAHSSKLENVVCTSLAARAITSGADGYVRVWNTDDRTEIYAFAQSADVKRIILAPSEQYVMIVDSQGAARIWSLRTGQLHALLSHPHEIIQTASFARDSRRILTVGITASMWLLHEPSVPMARFPDYGGKILSATFANDGRIFTLSEGGTVRAWHAADPQILGTWRPPSKLVWAMGVAPDGELLATGLSDNTAVLHAPAGTQVATLKHHTGPIYDITFSNDGQFFASVGVDQQIVIWNRKGQFVRSVRAHEKAINTVRFSPDDRWLLSSSDDGTARLWDVQTGALRHTLNPQDGRVLHAVFDSEGERIATGAFGPNVLIWDVATGARLRTIPAHGITVKGMQSSNHGPYLATAGLASAVKVWNIRTGELIARMEGHSSYVSAMDFGHDGRILATGGSDNMLMLWDTKTGALLDKRDMREQLHLVDFSDESDMLAVVTTRGLVRTWRVPLETRSAGELADLLVSKAR